MKKIHKVIPTTHLIIRKKEKILFSKRANTGYEDGKWSLVAGHTEENEGFIGCAVREAKEEIGIIIKKENLKLVHLLYRKSESERVDTFFIVDEWIGEIENKEPEKCSELSWFSIDNISENTVDYIKHVLMLVERGEVYSEIL